MRRMDLITGLVTAAVGAAAFWDARNLTMFGENSVPGPGFFPKILAGLLVGLGLILAGIAFGEKEPEPVEEEGASGEGPTRSGRIRAAAVLVAFAIFGLRQGTKVKRPPQNVPEDRSIDLTRWGGPRL